MTTFTITLDNDIELSQAKRVANGITYLDKRLPDWRTKIDIGELELYNYEKCILGQVFGGDEYGRLYDEKGVDWIVNHGFATDRQYWIDAL